MKLNTPLTTDKNVWLPNTSVERGILQELWAVSARLFSTQNWDTVVAFIAAPSLALAYLQLLIYMYILASSELLSLLSVINVDK